MLLLLCSEVVQLKLLVKAAGMGEGAAVGFVSTCMRERMHPTILALTAQYKLAFWKYVTRIYFGCSASAWLILQLYTF